MLECVVVTIGGHTVLYAYSFLLSPFGYKPSFRTSLTPATTPVSDFGGIDYINACSPRRVRSVISMHFIE